MATGALGGIVCRLQCEISSVEVTGLGCAGALFLRCHVPAGGGRTIQIDSHEAEARDGNVVRSAVSWRDVASLRCDGSPACVRELADRRSVVFEVRRKRRRRRAILVGRAVATSELVGRAEVAWRDAVVNDDDAAAVESRVMLAGRAVLRDDGVDAAVVPVMMSVRMSVRVSETAVSTTGRSVGSPAQRETGCEWSVGGEDVFGVAACDAFE